MHVWGQNMETGFSFSPLTRIRECMYGNRTWRQGLAFLPLQDRKGTETFEFYCCEGAMHPQIRAHLVV